MTSFNLPLTQTSKKPARTQLHLLSQTTSRPASKPSNPEISRGRENFRRGAPPPPGELALVLGILHEVADLVPNELASGVRTGSARAVLATTPHKKGSLSFGPNSESPRLVGPIRRPAAISNKKVSSPKIRCQIARKK